MAESPSEGPTIILIGGEITLDSGAHVDSRRPLKGDDWDFTLRTALGGSEAFWHKAKALSDIIIDEHDSPDAWALAWVNKTIKRPKADGTFTRVRTVKYLDDADQLLDSSKPEVSDRIDARYRIIPYFLRFADVAALTPPAVFVGAFHTTYEDGTDIVGLAPLSHVLSRWPKTTLVLPHTPLIERKAGDLVDLHRSGAQPPDLDKAGWVGSALTTNPTEAERFMAAYEATAEIRAADPYIIEHDLGITFWVDHGQIKEAADLDAALNFVMSRYDLDIGLWDLARDPVLRMSLLDPEEQQPVAQTPAEVPQELVEAATERITERRAAQQAEKEARQDLHDLLWPRLQELGWHTPPWKDPGTEYRFGVGPEVGSHYEGVESVPAVFFDLLIHKKQATLNLFAATWIRETVDFLAANANDIQSITGQPPEPGTNTVLRLPERGWDGTREQWQRDVERVSACIDLLTPRLGFVVDAAVEFHEQQLAIMELTDIAINVDVVLRGEHAPKRGFFRRLLGGE